MKSMPAAREKGLLNSLAEFIFLLDLDIIVINVQLKCHSFIQRLLALLLVLKKHLFQIQWI